MILPTGRAAGRRTGAILALMGLLTLPATAEAQGTAYEQLQAFSAVLSHARLNYVDSVDFNGLVRGAIRGLLSSLDPHSYYVTRREFELLTQWDRGELAGPGLELDNAGQVVTVLSVLPKGPAAKAGVEPGDRVLRVNDSTAEGLSAEAVQVQLVGEKGSKVRLVLERGNPLTAETLAVSLKRAEIDHPVVSSARMLGSETGYVRLAEFTPLASDELTKAVKKLRGKGAKQLILDLRWNPGGDMQAMASIASTFLPAHTEVFHTQGRKKTGLDSVITDKQGDFAKLPLIVLINSGTASAAEVMAGSLQDHDRALIVGRRSFGKALMQTSLPLPNGDVVWMTTARIVTPSGRIIQRRYRGQGRDQYIAGGGKGGSAEDTLASYRTDRGRQVRGGGGILPDVVRPLSAELPVWFSVAMDSGYASVADSAAQTLGSEPSAKAAWMADSAAWDAKLVAPFVARVRSGLGIQVAPGPAVRARIGRILASQTAAQRWGAEAGEDFLIASDADIRAAVNEFPQLPSLLQGKANTR
jgi:carboxyl-terminal processing protease